jgi:hypothetical protein
LVGLERQRTCDLHVQLFDEVSILEHLGCGQLASLRDLVDFIVSETNDNIFRLKICVDDFALAMHIVKTN